MKIITVIGARPQFIKAAAVSLALKENPGIEEVLVHTGQHFDGNMSQVFFDELAMTPPKHNLGISGGGHGAQTGRMLEGLESVLLAEKPDLVLVYGDTNSTLAGALAAAKLHIRVAHVEAGLRSFNRHMPEEINRILTDHLSDLLLVPTETGVHNLHAEGITADKIHLVGDVMYDAALLFGRKAESESQILRRLGVQAKAYILATIHRAENTDEYDHIRSILAGLAAVSKDWTVLLPIHPRTRKIIEGDGILSNLANHLKVLEPVGYLDMIMLEKNARLIATDSGGVQKEAFFYQVPCVTLRDETEWVELLESNWNTLAPPRAGSQTITDIITDRLNILGKDLKPYGDGNAAHKIASVLLPDQ